MNNVKVVKLSNKLRQEDSTLFLSLSKQLYREKLLYYQIILNPQTKLIAVSPSFSQEAEFMDPYMDEEENNNSGRRRQIDDDDDDDDEEEEEEEEEEAAGYRSKNLDAERRRRRRINDGLLELRALVPIITNMKKATIISDAIAYIEQLQTYVGDLSTQLLEMGAAFAEESKDGPMDAIHAAEETTMKWGIEPEVKVGKIEKNKVWIKLVCEKKRRGFSKLMEALSVAGYAFTDITLTTFQTAILVTASLTACHGGLVEAEQIRVLLQEIARSIQSSKE